MPLGKVGLGHRLFGGTPIIPDPCLKSHVSGPSAADCHLAAGLFAWLKADTLALADGAGVASWTDQSGSGHDFVNATPANQPVLKIVNGVKRVRFSALTGLSGAFFVTTADFTFHAAIQGDLALNGNGTLILVTSLNGGLTLSPTKIVTQTTFDESFGYDSGPPHSHTGTVHSPASCIPHVLSVVGNSVGNYRRLFRNGVPIATQVQTATSDTYPIVGGKWYLGSEEPDAVTVSWVGDLYEVMMHSVAQTDAQVLTVATCLQSRWGFP